MNLLVLLGVVVSHICFIGMFWIIGDLSRILGLALKKKPVYRMMYVSSFCVTLGMIFNLLGGGFLIFAMLFDIVGISLACYVIYFYWNWLPSDLSKG